jgi:hypothetical protein
MFNPVLWMIYIAGAGFLSSLALPVFFTGNEFNSYHGFGPLVFGPLDAIGASPGHFLAVMMWSLNLPFFYCMQQKLIGRVEISPILPLLLVIGSIIAVVLFPSVLILRDEAGNSDYAFLMNGGLLWAFSLFLCGAALLSSGFLKNAGEVWQVRAAAISAVIAFGLLSFSLLDIRAAQNVSLDPSVEFTDPQLVRALKGWSAKDINRQQLAEELEGKCSQAGRFGLAPIAYFLLKGDREGFSVCLSKVEVNSWVPEKYGHQNPGLWSASVLDDGMKKVFGQGESLLLKEQFLFPRLTSAADFYRGAKSVVSISSILRARKFKEYFRPEQGPILSTAIDFFSESDAKNSDYVVNLIWLTEVAPKPFASRLPTEVSFRLRKSYYRK